MANDAYAFLMRELEKIDEKIYEPLSGTDWPRDMPVITGGGPIETVSTIDVTYASSGGEEDNLFFEATNNIPVIQADMSKQIARTFNFAEYMSFTWLEREKMMGIGRDPETFLNKGIRLHCDKVIDRNVYKGFNRTNTTGLINNPNVMRITALPHTSGQTDTEWSGKTADEILRDINTVISAVWAANDCASDALPNHILIPVDQFGQLVTRKVADDSGKSILTYVLENNLSAQQGVNLVISPCKWCRTAGSDSTDHMVVYTNHADRICFNLTQPLTRLETERSDMRIKIPFFAQFSEVRFIYPSTVRYMDGI
jgi:hypothetical protein